MDEDGDPATIERISLHLVEGGRGDSDLSANGVIVDPGVLGPPVHLDIDGNGQPDALSDGAIILRYLFGFTGQGMVNGLLAPDAARTDPDEIAALLDGARATMLDVDASHSQAAFVVPNRLIAAETCNDLGPSPIGDSLAACAPPLLVNIPSPAACEQRAAG